MSRFVESLKAAPLLADGAIGSYLFEQTGRLSEANHVYEALNVQDPQVVRQLHRAYVTAGARCLTTNTFAANRAQLAAHGGADAVAELNRTAVQLARAALAESVDPGPDGADGFVLGSIGPGGAASRVASVHADQLQALLDAGVDALLLETFTDLDELRGVLALARRLDATVPVVAHMCLRQTGADGTWSQDPATFVAAAAEAGARVVGVNCCAPWEATAFLDAIADDARVRRGDVLLSAMPNAGGLQRIGHRYMTRVNAEYMGQLARTFARRGVRLIGGCCEVHPPHIREMGAYLSGLRAGRGAVRAVSTDARPPVADAAKKANGPFSRKIKEQSFAVSIEMLPSRGTSAQVLAAKAEAIGRLAASGVVDAVDVTDGSRGIPLMSPGDFIMAVRRHLGWVGGEGLEFIAHFTTRDLNTMGLQSRLIGYHANHIRNLLFVTGDPPKMSPTYPRSTAVFDLDSVALIDHVHACLNRGVDFGGRALGRHADPRTCFTIGTGFEPEALNAEHELEKLRRKIDHGADYVMTQPVFRYEPLAALGALRSRASILVGVMILTGIEHARRVAQVPGVVIAPEVLERLAAYERIEDQARAGRDLAVEQIAWVRREGWAGLYLMSPGSFDPVAAVLGEALGAT